jgi:hypothetical protein
VPRRNFADRKLELFAVHARTSEGPVNYLELFTWLASRKPRERYQELGDRLVAVHRLVKRGKYFALTAYEGPLGVAPLIFDAATGRARVERLAEREVMATATHAFVDAVGRRAVVEYNHRGAKAGDIAQALEQVGRAHFPELSIELNPVADESFVTALDRFERVRHASLRIARPNIDWSDHYNNLTKVAHDSNARTIQVAASANRGGSLNKNAGLMSFIRQLAVQGLAVLKGASVEGVRYGEDQPTTVSLKNHIEHQRISVPKAADGQVNDQELDPKLEAYLDAKRKGSE